MKKSWSQIDEGYTQHTQKIRPFLELYKLDINLLAEVIRHIETVEIEKTTIEKLMKLYRKLYGLLDIKMHVGTYYPYYYRARITSEDNVSALMNPPEKSIKLLGRCNDVGESLFYCSNCYATSILEVKPKLGDEVTVLVLEVPPEFENRKVFLPVTAIGGEELKEDFLQTFVLSGDPIIQNKLSAIVKLFDAVMLKQVPLGKEQEYKRSIALSKVIFEDQKGKPSSVMFPSKASRHYGINFAAHPRCIDDLHKTRYTAFRVKVLRANEDFKLKVLITETATEMDGEGNFLFKNVERFGTILDLDESFFDKYEKAFEQQKLKQKKGAFFRRFYAPPNFPAPYNLMHEKLYHFWQIGK